MSRSRIPVPDVLYRGVRDGDDVLRQDGCTVFLTDEPEEARGYGPTVVEARVADVDLFAPGHLVYRDGGDWEGSVGDADLSRRFLDMLTSTYGPARAEVVYHHVEGGSWSEVERPEIQEWLKREGFDGFTCWEGDGATYAVYDASKVEIVGVFDPQPQSGSPRP